MHHSKLILLLTRNKMSCRQPQETWRTIDYLFVKLAVIDPKFRQKFNLPETYSPNTSLKASMGLMIQSQFPKWTVLPDVSALHGRIRQGFAAFFVTKPSCICPNLCSITHRQNPSNSKLGELNRRHKNLKRCERFHVTTSPLQHPTTWLASFNRLLYDINLFCALKYRYL